MLLSLPYEPTPAWVLPVLLPSMVLLFWGLRRLEAWMERRNEQEQARRERIRAAQKTRRR